MFKAREIVERLVNDEIDKRGLMKHQFPGPWKSDVALCNKYDGGHESVGFHSDQMTHIGPHAVIASVSLGVTREFRMKKRHDKESSTISIHVPHNSVIIMHAGTQEEWKHSVVPTAGALDNHPISGQVRINITYRMYPEEFSTDRVPKCTCNRTMVLRTTIQKSQDQPYKYIWQCSTEKCNTLLFPKFRINDLANTS
jgi:hypothetical protein